MSGGGWWSLKSQQNIGLSHKRFFFLAYSFIFIFIFTHLNRIYLVPKPNPSVVVLKPNQSALSSDFECLRWKQAATILTSAKRRILKQYVGSLLQQMIVVVLKFWDKQRIWALMLENLLLPDNALQSATHLSVVSDFVELWS